MPVLTGYGDATARKAINRGEGEILCLTVVPAKTREDPDVVDEFLIHADAESVLQSAEPRNAPYGRSCPGRDGGLKSFAVTARPGVIEIVQQADRSRMRARARSQLAFEHIAAIA